MAYEAEAAMLREFGWKNRGIREVLALLEEEEQLILKSMFLVPRTGNLDRLCQELGVEKSSVYRRRDRALQRFSGLWLSWKAGNPPPKQTGIQNRKGVVG